MVAKDEGGPTRAFLNEVWRQLPELTVASEDKNVALFCKGYNGDIVPVDDDIICHDLKIKGDRKGAKALVQPFYRAIGRILLYCLCMNNTPIRSDDASEKQFYLIGSHIMPNIYRNYLLRGIDPTDDRYDISDLVHDVVTIRLNKNQAAKDDRDIDYFMNYLLGACGDNVENVSDSDELQRRFRQYTKESLIDGCLMALEALKMGLTLDGKLDPFLRWC
jgi:uncharacterized protein YihD (DUF1040 family)